jgi:hypothetical protein
MTKKEHNNNTIMTNTIKNKSLLMASKMLQNSINLFFGLQTQ